MQTFIKSMQKLKDSKRIALAVIPLILCVGCDAFFVFSEKSHSFFISNEETPMENISIGFKGKVDIPGNEFFENVISAVKEDVESK